MDDTMPIRFRCPTGHALTVPTDWMGRTMTCPICRSPTAVPSPKAALASLARQSAGLSATIRVHAEHSAARRLPRRPLYPTLDQRRALHHAAAALAMVAVAAAIPVVGQLPSATLPTWAQLSLAVMAVQLAYVGWMLSLPDWSTLRLTTWVFALIASGYASLLAALYFAPPGRLAWLELDPLKQPAIGWCLLVATGTTAVCLWTGRRAAAWRGETRPRA